MTSDDFLLTDASIHLPAPILELPVGFPQGKCLMVKLAAHQNMLEEYCPSLFIVLVSSKSALVF